MFTLSPEEEVEMEKKRRKKEKWSSPGGLEPPTFRLTAERANRLRHGDRLEILMINVNFKGYYQLTAWKEKVYSFFYTYNIII